MNKKISANSAVSAVRLVNMKCTLCGYEFDESEAANSCKGCPMTAGCALIKCPRCGFETPPEPKWLKNLFKRSGFAALRRDKKGKNETK